MEYRIIKKEPGLCRLEASFSEADVQAAWKKAASHFGSAMAMPGFRKGKVPPAVLEKQFGPAMLDFATDTLVKQAAEQAFASEGVTPVSAFAYEGGLAERGKAFGFALECCAVPEGFRPDLTTISLEFAEAVADPVQEALFLREMLSRGAKSVQVTEGTPQDGDIVSADVLGRVDGRPVPGLAGPCRMRLMPPVEGEKVPDLDPILRRLHIGETGTGTTPCPDNFPDPAFRGRSIELSVTLRSIEREELPELSDVTARRLGFRSAESMKLRAHEQAEDMDRLHKRSQCLQAIRQALESWPDFEAPTLMVKQLQEESFRRSVQYMQKQAGLAESMARMKAEADAYGVRRARCRTLLLAWAACNGVELPENELDAVLRGRAARQSKHPDEYLLGTARTGEACDIRAAMLEEKALYALFEAIKAKAE